MEYSLARLLDNGGQHELGGLVVDDDVAVIDVRRDGVLVLLLVGAAGRVGGRLVRHDPAGMSTAVQGRFGQSAGLGDVLDDTAASEFREVGLTGRPLLPRPTPQGLLQQKDQSTMGPESEEVSHPVREKVREIIERKNWLERRIRP